MFDHIYFEVYMTIHVLALAHYYMADKINLGNDSASSQKDIIKDSSTQLKLAYCKSKYLVSRCSGIRMLPFKEKKAVVEFTDSFNQYLFNVFALHHQLIQLQFPLVERKAYEMATKMACQCQKYIREISGNIESIKTEFKQKDIMKMTIGYLDVLTNTTEVAKYVARGMANIVTNE